MEPDETARRAAAARGIAVHAGTAEALPDELLGGAAFDLVLLIHTLEHLVDPLLGLRNAAGLLAPGGTFAAEVPNHGSSGFRRSQSAWFHTDAGRHLSFFTARSLELAVRAVGLEPAAFEFRGYTEQFTDGWVEAEQEVWDRLYGGEGARVASAPRRPSALRSWKLLARTLLAGAERKYDSVRVYARKPRAAGTSGEGLARG